MTTGQTLFPDLLNATLIAPCGMNCGLCIGHRREKNRCAGCNGDDAGKPHHCVVCRIKRCPEIVAATAPFCFECAKFPCARLRRLDERYRAKYGMSMVENLNSIRDVGLERFVAAERERWRCAQCGAVLCVHTPSCLCCGHVRSQVWPAPENQWVVKPTGSVPSMLNLHTARIDLVPLGPAQLALYLEQPGQLEQDLGVPLSRAILTEPVRRAIRMKLAKMDQAEAGDHPWYTYWLLVIRVAPFGAGLLGFKGVPDPNGEVEIGYGIDPEFSSQGYVSEAVRGLLGWAFEHEQCRSVVACRIQKSNVASQRVAEKVGMGVYEESSDGLSYRVQREDRHKYHNLTCSELSF